MTNNSSGAPASDWKDYNTERSPMSMPEYGRNVQRMVLSLLGIADRSKRTQQAYAVIATMGNLFPHLRNIEDFKHKLWDHLFVISNFQLDIDSPYPKPEPDTFKDKPDNVSYLNPKEVGQRHYGRYIPNMVWYAGNLPSCEARTILIKTIANHMKRIYLAWNKDVVTDEIIFKDIEALSGGKIIMDAANTRLKVGNYTKPNTPNNNGNGKTYADNANNNQQKRKQ